MRSVLLIFLSCSAFAAFSQSEASLPSQKDSLAIKQLFFAGLRDKLMGNAEVSKESFLKILSIDKENDAAVYELATGSLRLGHLQEAAQYAKEATKLQPNNKFYFEVLAQALKEANNFTALQLVLDDLIRLDPENRDYYFDKADIQLRVDNAKDAEKTYTLIQQKFGSSEQLSEAKRRLSDKNGTGNTVESLLENNAASAKDYLYAANALLQESRIGEALNILKKADLLFPQNYEVKLYIADIYKKNGELKESLESLKSAFNLETMPISNKIKIVAGMFSKMEDEAAAKDVIDLVSLLVEQNPNNAKVLGLYGDVLFRQRKFVAALVQYQKALNLDDQNFSFWEGIINTHNLLGQYPEAIKVGDEALTNYPNQAILYFYTAYAQYRSSKLESALKNLEMATSLALDDRGLLAQSYALKADILIDKGNAKEAKLAFEQAVKQEPDNYQIITKAAYFLALRDEDLDVAESYASKAANAQPENPYVTDTYAFVLFKQKKYKEAKKWIELTLQNKKSENDVYLEHYGDILFLLGDKENALQQWTLAKKAGNTSKNLSKKINEKKYFK